MSDQIQFRSFRFVNPLDRRDRRGVAALDLISDEDGARTYKVGIAVSHPSDNFVRKNGQIIAQGKLNSEKRFTVVSNADLSKRIVYDLTGEVETLPAGTSLTDTFRACVLMSMRNGKVRNQVMNATIEQMGRPVSTVSGSPRRMSGRMDG